MSVLTNGVILAAALGVAAGAAIGGPAGSFDITRGQADIQVARSRDHGVVDAARALLGTPYVFGGSTRFGVDESGLVMLAFAEVGVRLPHSISGQDREGRRVDAADARPGDLVVADDLRSIGIYLGDGEMISVSPPTTRLTYVSIVPVFAEAHHFTRIID
jgi:cell wall-associated NlpC family hydrolase